MSNQPSPLTPIASIGPKFCPRCGQEDRPEASLCSTCRAALQGQGYCPVCERFLRQPTGSTCPKHDVTLDDGPPPPAFGPGETPPSAWYTLGTFETWPQVNALRVRLEAESIPTFVDGSRMGDKSMLDIATGGLKLQVPQTYASDARAIVAQTWTPAPDDDLDDAWDDLGPEPGAFRRRVMKGLIVVFLLSPLPYALFGSVLHIL